MGADRKAASIFHAILGKIQDGEIGKANKLLHLSCLELIFMIENLAIHENVNLLDSKLRQTSGFDFILNRKEWQKRDPIRLLNHSNDKVRIADFQNGG